ncbi:MAG: (2E,6E)-farnesyl diphosphate synthase [Gammaproteobacteria bacterium]|nr:(2E,6E)-farnesyl diphosphate synthase [Gammaproteobacteria bacterium]
MPVSSQLQSFISSYQQRVNHALEKYLHDMPSPDPRLSEAMLYSLTGPGKRIRPLLVYAAGLATDVGNEQQLDTPACAVEMIHAFSLIHDDLPAMDNDDLRRGRATCHKAFDEATAILAGDALQTMAFEILSNDASGLSGDQRLKMIAQLASATGARGMTGGQAIDLAAVGSQLTLEQLEAMHGLKTGALIRASVIIGGLCNPDVTKSELDMLDNYAQCIGLCFQIQDDILDVTSDTATLGKPQGSDQKQGKPTYSAILGLDAAKQLAQEQHNKAIAHLVPLGEKANILRQIADYIIERDC